MVEVDLLGLDGEVEVRLGGGELRLLLVAVIGIDGLRVFAFRLVELGGDGGERVAPAIDRVVGILGGDGSRLGVCVGEEVEIGGAVVVLHPGGDLLDVDSAERGEGLLDPILQ